ncbi:MAG TPA: hypothetical protein VM425_00540 [Myxococcota bacterium]|nr:hypothetical protein [Myxococcota bacterium]
MNNNELPDQVWDVVQSHLGYTDQEMELFKKDPRNAKVLAMTPDMKSKTIVFEVIESKGCNSKHVAGSRFYFSGDGNLLTKMAPSKVCAYLLPILGQAIYGIQELWYAGVDPNELCFKRAGCFDVGVQCGGWGHLIVESKVMSREDATKLFEQSR